MYPARTKNRWLATSASAGASRSVGIKSSDQRCILSLPVVGEKKHSTRMMTSWPGSRQTKKEISHSFSIERQLDIEPPRTLFAGWARDQNDPSSPGTNGSIGVLPE